MLFGFRKKRHSKSSSSGACCTLFIFSFFLSLSSLSLSSSSFFMVLLKIHRARFACQRERNGFYGDSSDRNMVSPCLTRFAKKDRCEIYTILLFFSLWYFVLILVIVNLKTDTKTKMRTMIQSYESLCCQYSKIFFFKRIKIIDEFN